MIKNTLLGWFRVVALLEGLSYVLLFFVAMPLKYLLDMPAAVRYLGWAHGILFILYFVFLTLVFFRGKWPFWKLIVSGLASVLPFGTFFLDARMLKEENQAE